MITREEVLREVPLYSRHGRKHVRPAFHELHRVASSHKVSERDLHFLKEEIVARKKALGFDRPPKKSQKWKGYIRESNG